MKCELCGKKIEETFLGKLQGTLVKINKGGKNEVNYACSGCQQKHGDKLKEELSKK